MLCSWKWKNEHAPRRWRGVVLIVSLFKKGDKADPGTYRGITLLSTVGKTFCITLNDRMGTMIEKRDKMSEGHAGFRPSCSCVDHVCTSGKIIQGGKDAGLTKYCLFLRGCTEGPRYGMEKWTVEMWGIGIRGKMWRIMKNML